MKWRGPLSGHGPQAESRVSRCDLPRPESRRPARADLLGQCGSPALRRSDAGAETAPKAFGETRLSQPPFERRAESRPLGCQRAASLWIGGKAIARSPAFARASNTSLATWASR